jgi:hypothetical protein
VDYKYFSPKAMAVLAKYQVSMVEILADALDIHRKTHGDKTLEVLLARKIQLTETNPVNTSEQFLEDCAGWLDYLDGVAKVHSEVHAAPVVTEVAAEQEG